MPSLAIPPEKLKALRESWYKERQELVLLLSKGASFPDFDVGSSASMNKRLLELDLLLAGSHSPQESEPATSDPLPKLKIPNEWNTLMTLDTAQLAEAFYFLTGDSLAGMFEDEGMSLDFAHFSSDVMGADGSVFPSGVYVRLHECAELGCYGPLDESKSVISQQARLAQRLEQGTHNPLVGGSNPSPCTNLSSKSNMSLKVSGNVPGKFYVDHSCIGCDICKDHCGVLIKDMLQWNSKEEAYFVARQPWDAESLAQMQEVVKICPSESVYDDGEFVS